MNNTITSAQKNLTKIHLILEQSESRPLKNEEIQETLQNSLEIVRALEETPETEVLKKALARSVDELCRLRIVNAKGFVNAYLEALEDFDTPNEAFEFMNSYYLKRFGETKYNDFESFKVALGMN